MASHLHLWLLAWRKGKHEPYQRGDLLHSARKTFRDLDTCESRGYVVQGTAVAQAMLSAGRHVLTARLKTLEPFGWGLTVAVQGEGVRV